MKLSPLCSAGEEGPVASTDGGIADPDRGRPATTGLLSCAIGSGSVEAWARLPGRARGPPPGTRTNCRADAPGLISAQKQHGRCRHIGRAKVTHP